MNSRPPFPVAVRQFREEEYGVVSIKMDPPNRSTDNGLLFSATYLALFPYARESEREWFESLVRCCEVEPGLYARYPHETDLTAHDDYVGILVASYLADLSFPAEIEKRGGFLGKYGDRYFGRFPYWFPLVKAAQGKRLGLLGQIMAAISYIADTRQPKEETNGRCLLLLMHLVFDDQKGWIIQRALRYWRRKMSSMYQSPGELHAIYFGAEHPFAKYPVSLDAIKKGFQP